MLLLETKVLQVSLQKWLADFGPPVVAQMFLDATTKPTSRKDSGEPRSPAAEFIQLAKGLERDNKQRCARWQPSLECASDRGAQGDCSSCRAVSHCFVHRGSP